MTPKKIDVGWKVAFPESLRGDGWVSSHFGGMDGYFWSSQITTPENIHMSPKKVVPGKPVAVNLTLNLKPLKLATVA